MALTSRLAFISIVCIELFILAFAYREYRNKLDASPVLGVGTTAPSIRKEDLIISSDEEEKFFYESKSNHTIVDNPSWLGHAATYSINSDSLNERYEYDTPKPPGVFRIITLGDSHTFGHYVNTKDNWPEKLEDRLNTMTHCQNPRKFEVINLGERGYDIAFIVKKFRKRGLKYSPDLILWLESGSGFKRLLSKALPLVNTCERQASIPAHLRDLKQTYYCYDYANRAVQKQYSESEIALYLRNKWDDFFEAKGNVPFIYMLYLDEANLNNKSIGIARSWMKDRPNTTVYHGLPYIYHGKELILPDGHPNEIAYDRIANTIADYLTDQDIIGCGASQSGSLQ